MEEMVQVVIENVAQDSAARHLRCDRDGHHYSASLKKFMKRSFGL